MENHNCVRGWVEPSLPVERFLKAYSSAGGTPHAALVYSGEVDVIAAFGRIMGWKVVLLAG